MVFEPIPTTRGEVRKATFFQSNYALTRYVERTPQRFN